MSKNYPADLATFIASASDPSRALPLKKEVFEALVAALDTIVLPQLKLVCRALKSKGWPVASARRWSALAGAGAEWKSAGLKAWIRFQIHETFASLVKPDPVFWMSAVYVGDKLAGGASGRLTGIQPEEI